MLDNGGCFVACVCFVSTGKALLLCYLKGCLPGGRGFLIPGMTLFSPRDSVVHAWDYLPGREREAVEAIADSVTR